MELTINVDWPPGVILGGTPGAPSPQLTEEVVRLANQMAMLSGRVGNLIEVVERSLSSINHLRQEVATMSQSITDLQTAQAAANDAMDAAVAEMTDAETVLADLASQIKSAGTDPAALAAVTASLTAKASALSSSTTELKTAADALKAIPTPPALDPGATPGGVPADPVPVAPGS